MKHHIKIYASAKLSGHYSIEDIDVVVIGNFYSPKIFVPRYSAEDQFGNEIYNKKVIIQNFLITVEVKDQDPRDIRFTGDSIEHRYPSDNLKWHSTSDQSKKQVGSLVKYAFNRFQRKEFLHIFGLIFLRNMPESSQNFIGANSFKV